MNSKAFLNGGLVSVVVLAVLSLPLAMFVPGVMGPISWMGRVVELGYLVLIVGLVLFGLVFSVKNRRNRHDRLTVR